MLFCPPKTDGDSGKYLFFDSAKYYNISHKYYINRTILYLPGQFAYAGHDTCDKYMIISTNHGYCLYAKTGLLVLQVAARTSF
jgi:hypothetical protein